MSTKVQARFYVSEVTRYAYNPENLNVVLRAVGRGEENKTWASATPMGEMKLTIGNAAAAKWFEERLGKDVALTFEDRGIDCVDCGQDATVGLAQHQAPFSTPRGPQCIKCWQKQQSLA